MPTIRRLDDPTQAVRDAILAPLVAYNESRAGPSGARLLALAIEQPDTGAVIGGLWGRIIFRWLFVELLAVPEALRGQDYGTMLMGEAEAFARHHGCVGVWLDTFTFQAPGFYEKLGYKVFGTIDDHPPDASRLFLQKRLSASNPHCCPKTSIERADPLPVGP